MYGFSPTVQKVWSLMFSLRDGLGGHDVILVSDWFLMMSKSQPALRPVLYTTTQIHFSLLLPTVMVEVAPCKFWYFPGSWLVNAQISPILRRGDWRAILIRHGYHGNLWDRSQVLCRGWMGCFPTWQSIFTYYVISIFQPISYWCDPLRSDWLSSIFSQRDTFFGLTWQHSTHCRQTLRLRRWRPSWILKTIESIVLQTKAYRLSWLLFSYYPYLRPILLSQ